MPAQVKCQGEIKNASVFILEEHHHAGTIAI